MALLGFVVVLLPWRIVQARSRLDRPDMRGGSKPH